MAKKDRDLTKKSGGNKKKGRNRKKCERYRLHMTRERNRDRRMERIARSLARAAQKRAKRANDALFALEADLSTLPLR